MVKIMTRIKTISSIFIILVLSLALIQGTTAQTQEEMVTFLSKTYAVISIQVNATRETVPRANITMKLMVNCTADNVYVHYLNISVYGYRHINYVVEEATLKSESIMKQTPLGYRDISQHNITVPVPNDVWDLTYCKLCLKYDVAGTPLLFDEKFPMTIVKDVRRQELEERLAWLNTTYWQLHNTFEQLNNTFWQIFQMNLTAESLAQLNETYRGLKETSNELSNTRMVVGVLAVTTALFVAATLYLILKKPKQYW